MERVNKLEDYVLGVLKGKSGQIHNLLAQAFMAGYEKGFSESTHKIEIEGIKFYDLNLPSGTLWNTPIYCYNYGWHLKLATYDEVKDLGLPTKSQWDELCHYCCIKGLKLIAPNGLRLGYPDSHHSTPYTIYTLGENCEKGHNRFWLKSMPDKENYVDVIEFDNGVNTFRKHFTGFRLPFFLVRKINN